MAHWIRARQTQFTLYATLYILIVGGALVLANWLANRHNKSVDTTANKRFSLSPQTEKVVRDLKQEVRISYWDRTDSFQRARDLLQRYDDLSQRVHVDYFDPYKRPTEARAAGVRQEGFILVQSGQRREEARSLSEEEVTGAIIRTIKTQERTVCAVEGSGEQSFTTGFTQLQRAIERDRYRTQTISLVQKPEVPPACTVVIVGGPRYDYIQPAVDALRKYVEGGGRLLMMLDPPLQLERFTIAENAPLVSLLQSWGVTMNRDLVIETSPIAQAVGLSASAPLIVRYQSHPVVREMSGLATAFPMTRSLELKSGDKVNAEKLFETSTESFSTNNMNGEVKPDRKGPLTLAAAVTYNTGQQNSQGRVIVLGSSNWAANDYLGFNGNRDLALNMLNWLSSDEDLISIRPRDPEERRLSMTRGQLSVVAWTSMLLLPLAVILSGVSVWWKRR